MHAQSPVIRQHSLAALQANLQHPLQRLHIGLAAASVAPSARAQELVFSPEATEACLADAQDRGARWYDWPSRVVNRGFGWLRERAFRPLMRWVVRLRYPVLAAAVLALASSVSMFLRGDVVWLFFDPPEGVPSGTPTCAATDCPIRRTT